MNDKYEDKYTESYIAFLDILGFKNLVGRVPCNEIVELFKKIRNPLEDISIGKIMIDTSKVKIKVMSDSICFHIATREDYALYSIIAVCQDFQCELLRLTEPILVRGAIVCGEIFQNEDITFGPGFIKAWSLEENEAKNPRIIFEEDVLENGIEKIRAKKDLTEDENSLIDALKGMISDDKSDDRKCINYGELFEGLDTDESAVAKLIKYTDEQIKCHTSYQQKWVYTRERIREWANR